MRDVVTGCLFFITLTLACVAGAQHRALLDMQRSVAAQTSHQSDVDYLLRLQLMRIQRDLDVLRSRQIEFPDPTSRRDI